MQSTDKRYNEFDISRKTTKSSYRSNGVFRIFRPLFSNQITRFFSTFIKNKEIFNKILITLGIVVVYRILSTVPLPGMDMTVFENLLSNRTTTEANYLFSLFTGGRLESPSIVGMGLAAYINASIIMQMLPYALPKLKEIQKQGERGRQIINQYTRFLTLPLALLYSFGYLVFLSQQNFSTSGAASYLIPHAPGSDYPTLAKILLMTLVLAAGTLFLMWLSEIITEKGMGNGSSVMITVGILATLPSYIVVDFSKLNISEVLNQLSQGNILSLFNAVSVSIILSIIGILVMIVVLIFINESQRNIPVQYARRVRGAESGKGSSLPIKFTLTGVLPIIFTYAILSVPQLLVPILEKVTQPESGFYQFLQSLKTSFLYASSDAVVNSNDTVYAIVYFFLVIIFGVFYAFIVLNPKETAENLQKSGAFVPGIRPGKSTEKYISSVLLKMGVAGSVVLAFIALVPILARDLVLSSTGSQLAILSGIGGTTLLIVVSVVLDTIRQYRSLRATKSYERYS